MHPVRPFATGVPLAARVLACAFLLGGAAAEAQMELGHKTLGTLGLDAGTQPDTGLYVADRFIFYGSGEVFDRNGERIPVDLDIDAFANGVGIAGTYQLTRFATFVNASFAVPIARVRITSDRPEASIDRFGLADLYFQPIRLGWRLPHLDLVTGYAAYIPTGSFSPGQHGGVSRAQWSHEFSLGGTLYFKRDKSWQLSALSSYEHNERKDGIDLTRGDTVQIQGGAGTTMFRLVSVGVVGYALWQVRADRGAALPAALRGAHDQSCGFGLEADLTLPWIRARLITRWAHDFAVESRPLGEIFLVGLTYAAWHPRS